MTLINLTVLADALGTAAPIDAVLEAEATSARTAGAEARTPQKIVVPITAGAPSAPLNLEPTGIGWCWKLVLMVPATGYRITRFVQVPATGTVTWEDLVDVNPLTLKVLPDAVPAWKAAMDDLLAARDAAVLAEVAAGIARDESVAAKDLAVSTVADVALTADTALTNAATAQSTADTAVTNAATAQATADAALPVNPSVPMGDLNDLMEIGLYRQSNGMNSTLANNYPLSGLAYLIEVLPGGGSAWRVQRATAFVSGNKTATFVRTFADSWGAWQHQPSQRIDNTAGRAIYTWDDTQNRETLIYGDTGWRNISSLLDPQWELAPSGGVFAIRRELSTVTLRFRIRPLVTTPARAATRFLNAPLGFEPGAYTVSGVCSLGLIGGSTTVGFVRNGADIAGIDVNDFATSPTFSWSPANHLAGEITWSTSKGWPTVLPGTASGAIPFN